MNVFTERLTIDELHRDEIYSVRLADLVNMRNVLVIERGCCFGFLHEPAHAFSIRSGVRWKYFQRNLAIELCVLCEINFTHSAPAEKREQFVTAEPCASG